MGNVTNTSQLSLYSTIVSAIRSDAVLAARFNTSQFYEFEPNFKSRDVKLPLIVVSIPSTARTDVTTNNATKIKTFTSNIMLKMDYDARDKASDYCNRIIRAIENSESSFVTINYYNLNVNLSSPPVEEIEDMKQIVTALFELELTGAVSV